MIELPKHIDLNWRGASTAVPFLPFISGKKKIEMEAIETNIFDTKLSTKQVDTVLNNRIFMDTDNLLDNLTSKKIDENDRVAQVKAYQNGLMYYRDEIAIAYIKSMLSWDEIKDEELKTALGSDYNSDF